MRSKIPNALTWLRIAAIPVMVLIYFIPNLANREVIITTLFVVAAITDWLDGYLARRWNITSPFGAFLDPVADKLIVSTALVLLVSDVRVLEQAYLPIVFIISVAIIIGREIVISALRELMAEMGKRGQVAVDKSGKIKTAVQLVAISLLLYAKPLYGLPTFKIGEWLLYLAVALTLWSMWVYLSSAVRSFNEDAS